MKQDDVMTIMAKIATKLGTSLKKTDFKVLYIANHRNKTSSHITGTFYEERKHNEVFIKQKLLLAEKNPILMEDVINLPQSSPLRGTQVRIRTMLTQHTWKLLVYTRSLASNQFEFIWERDGKIMMRKNTASRPIEVISSSTTSSRTQPNQVIQSHNNVWTHTNRRVVIHYTYNLKFSLFFSSLISLNFSLLISLILLISNENELNLFSHTRIT